MFNVLLKKVARQEGIVVGSKTCRLICIVTRFVRFVEISVERKRKKKKKKKDNWSTPCPDGISSLSPQFCLICPARASSKINSSESSVSVSNFSTRAWLSPFHFPSSSLFLFFPPPDGVSLLHFARSRSFHAWHRSNAWRARKEGGCRIGRRIREIAGTMDSLASTVYFRKRNSSFLETRGNLAEILEKIRNGWVRKKEEGKKKTGKRKGKAYNEKKKKKNCFAWVREVKER